MVKKPLLQMLRLDGLNDVTLETEFHSLQDIALMDGGTKVQMSFAKYDDQGGIENLFNLTLVDCSEIRLSRSDFFKRGEPSAVIAVKVEQNTESVLWLVNMSDFEVWVACSNYSLVRWKYSQ